jgi:hypothetical protein
MRSKDGAKYICVLCDDPQNPWPPTRPAAGSSSQTLQQREDILQLSQTPPAVSVQTARAVSSPEAGVDILLASLPTVEATVAAHEGSNTGEELDGLVDDDDDNAGDSNGIPQLIPQREQVEEA